MHLSQIISLAALSTAVSAITVSFDPGYDDRGRSLNSVACSDGSNGLTRRGWKTQGDIPIFPYIGGAQAIAGWNSPECGSCWKLDYDGRSIKVLAIDHTDAGFNIAEAAMNALTDGLARQVGRVDAQATKLTPKDCGL
ncbi:hypothetical protein CDD82_4155 [Ophiocordyceps australis]|uniref:Cerato-platanin n=1 Tax=Ophiocordyceps australis TaxID=1399860 RepID=A0A2C5Z4T4_9HYPO|nr:hypothetical protein CDD82_4155 [Ophiocordyceps australis]